jgi:hypothetical protein
VFIYIYRFESIQLSLSEGQHLISPILNYYGQKSKSSKLTTGNFNNLRVQRHDDASKYQDMIIGVPNNRGSLV